MVIFLWYSVDLRLEVERLKMQLLSGLGGGTGTGTGTGTGGDPLQGLESEIQNPFDYCLFSVSDSFELIIEKDIIIP